MGFIGKILGAVIDVVEVPVAVARDVLTLGGSLDGEQETYTEKSLTKLGDDLRDL